jgi:hypothetical protein
MRNSTSDPAAIQAVFSGRVAWPAERAPGDAPAPQRWQKRAPAESSAWQAAQVLAPRGAPQRAQKFPEPELPHAGHARTDGVDVMDGK